MSNLIPASGFGTGSARAAGSGLVSSVTGSGGRPRGLARAEQQRIERETSLVAGRLRQQAFRVQGEMMRRVVEELRRRS